MPIRERRDKIVNIRVSESEFATIENSARAVNARTISDYVRSLILDRSTEQSQIASRLTRLEGIVGKETA